MNNSLTQKSAFKSVTYTIEDTGLMRKITTKGGESEYHFPFEQVKTNKATVVEQSKPALVIGILFAAIALFVFVISFSNTTVEAEAAPFWLAVSATCLTFYFLTRAKKIYLQTDNGTLEFMTSKRRQEEVNRFIEQVITERNAYLLSKYSQPTRNLEYAPQLENLNWLLNNRVLLKKQYDEKVQELNNLFSSHSGNKTIGFSTNN